MDSVPLQERLDRAKEAALLTGAHLLNTSLVLTVMVGYWGVKAVAVPVNVVEAFWRPKDWSPPWG